VTTVIDSNVIAALWNLDAALNAAARSTLDAALARGPLVVPAPVYSELMAFAGRTESFLDGFFRDTGIAVAWHMEERVWRSAGHAFQSYAGRRRRQREPGPRRYPQLLATHPRRRRIPRRLPVTKDSAGVAAHPDALHSHQSDEVGAIVLRPPGLFRSVLYSPVYGGDFDSSDFLSSPQTAPFPLNPHYPGQIYFLRNVHFTPTKLIK
jgi:hypothetical protein